MSAVQGKLDSISLTLDTICRVNTMISGMIFVPDKDKTILNTGYKRDWCLAMQIRLFSVYCETSNYCWTSNLWPVYFGVYFFLCQIKYVNVSARTKYCCGQKNIPLGICHPNFKVYHCSKWFGAEFCAWYGNDQPVYEVNFLRSRRWSTSLPRQRESEWAASCRNRDSLYRTSHSLTHMHTGVIRWVCWPTQTPKESSRLKWLSAVTMLTVLFCLYT